jgi:two-component system, LytTR family, sensor kinase
MIVSAASLGVAVLAAVDYLAWRRLSGWSTGKPHDLLFASTGDWIVCAFLVPIIFGAIKRWPVVGWRRVGLHLALAIGLWLVAGAVYQGLLAMLFSPHAVQPDVIGAPAVVRVLTFRVLGWYLSTLAFGVGVYLSVIGVELALRYFSEAREREVQMARLSEQLTNARFAALQSQLNPHFLFNTLNTIAVRARDGDGPGTARMVEQLSEVLRRTLSRHRENEVRLEEELELVREYLAIEQARFSDRLHATFEIDDATTCAAVPSFALQHLIENAIRHGIAKRPGAGRVRIAARRDRDTLEVSVTDDGLGVGAPRVMPPGHGLATTQERLRALYGDAASLAVSSAAAAGTVATLRVPYRELLLESGGVGR